MSRCCTHKALSLALTQTVGLTYIKPFRLEIKQTIISVSSHQLENKKQTLPWSCLPFPLPLQGLLQSLYLLTFGFP